MRKNIINAINRERKHQELKADRLKWRKEKSIMEWAAILEAELQEVKQDWIKKGDDACMVEMLQVATVAIACIEQHGVRERDNFEVGVLPEKSDKNILVAKIFYDASHPLIIPFKDLSEWLKEESENCDEEDLASFSIDIEFMSVEEFNNLEEHQGW